MGVQKWKSLRVHPVAGGDVTAPGTESSAGLQFGSLKMVNSKGVWTLCIRARDLAATFDPHLRRDAADEPPKVVRGSVERRWATMRERISALRDPTPGSTRAKSLAFPARVEWTRNDQDWATKWARIFPGPN